MAWSKIHFDGVYCHCIKPFKEKRVEMERVGSRDGFGGNRELRGTSGNRPKRSGS